MPFERRACYTPSWKGYSLPLGGRGHLVKKLIKKKKKKKEIGKQKKKAVAFWNVGIVTRTKQKKREKEGFVIFVSASTSLIKWSIGEVPVVRFCWNLVSLFLTSRASFWLVLIVVWSSGLVRIAVRTDLTFLVLFFTFYTIFDLLLFLAIVGGCMNLFKLI